ncbi:protein I'm not dead yet-like [Hyposmocoma kahamanoa]|uniref:protein I'm not dead yet-like n=1 Tax=Hyposmocoma kahamanoa TaxID=1477025 RepID=UPI000E6D718A|nr:protein I'm not dead yet-like [Hyposmocoma kahamanoa]
MYALFSRLSFLLFISAMFISMWVSNGLACGLMMPIVKAILMELERMGILEMYQMVDKTRQQSSRHEQKSPKPTDFTVFYFLGIAYSSTLGGIATLSGSNSNDVLKYYFESYFPDGPKLEFPHFMLLNLPGVLLMESLLYLWLNFFFMGMFRSQSDIALQIGISEEEAQYIQTLLANQYIQLGRISFHEAVVAIVVFLDITFDAVSFATRGHSNVSSPTIVFVVLLYILPRNMEFMRFFRRRSATSVSPLPIKETNGCLNWDLVRDNMLWEVIFIIGSSSIIFDNMMMSQMANEFETFLLYFKEWPVMVLSLIVIVLCKTLTEFASNSSVAYLILPCIARFSVLAKVNPIYMMTAATISGSLPFNLITGTSAHAFVIAYVNMPHYKMVQAGIGPSLFSIIIIWSTVTLWATTIWPDIMLYPAWAAKDLIIVNITS